MVVRRLCTALVLGVIAATAIADGLPFARRATTRPCPRCGIPKNAYPVSNRSRSEMAVSRVAMLLPTQPIDVESLGEVISRSERRLTDSERRSVENGASRINRSRSRVETEFREDGSRELIESDNDNLLRPRDPRNSLLDRWLPREPEPLDRTRDRSLRDTVTRTRPLPNRGQTSDRRLYQLDRPVLAIDQCEISQVALLLDADGNWTLSLRADQNRQPETEEERAFNPRLHIKRNRFHVQLRCLGSYANEPAENTAVAGRPILAQVNPRPFWVQNGQPRTMRIAGIHSDILRYFDQVDRVEIEFYYD